MDLQGKGPREAMSASGKSLGKEGTPLAWEDSKSGGQEPSQRSAGSTRSAS